MNTEKIKQSNKDGQHIVPRTYLKYWKIADDKNFVYGIDFSNQYKKGVQTFGLNDKVFKQHKYYNHPSFEKPYIIEDVLGEEIEPTYDKIMSEINREQNLSQSVKEKIMQWLYISKMRSPHIRDNTERIVNSLYTIIEQQQGKSITDEKGKEIKEYARRIAKDVQLNAFVYNEQLKELLTLFIETLNAKHWRILKSTPLLEFWTNDNPGFSPNTVKRFAKDTPYHHVMELNANSIIFYPLSPQYCLEITPYRMGTPLNICALTMEIKYEQASMELIEYINKGICFTCNNLVIANNKEILEYCIERV